MGAVPYSYFVRYQPDVSAALQELREREFRAGRYNPVQRFPSQSIGPESAAGGVCHRSIREALRAAGADGTRSILDLDRVSAEPTLGAVAPFPDEALRALYGTTQPTREMIEHGADSEYFDRGQGIYIVVYRDGEPAEIYFAGLSYD